MSPLVYLVSRRMKNSLKNLVKQPSKLIVVLIFVGLLLVSILPMITGDAEVSTGGFRSMDELYAIVFALFSVFFILTVNNGFGSGSSMYSMADVNMLFETPIKSGKILFYGLLRQLTMAMLVCIFIVYEYAMLHNIYGISFGFIIGILLCFALVIMAGQMTAMLIYSKTSADDNIKRKWHIGFYCVIIVAVALIGARVFAVQRGNVLSDAVGVINSAAVSLFPVSGWMKAVVFGFNEGALLPAVGGLCATSAFIAAMVAIVAHMKTDYYEDVLAATEVAHSAITARKEGMMNEVVPKNVKVGKTGIGGGDGSSVLYYKQKLERRRGRVFIVDTNSLIFIIVTIVVSLFVNLGASADAGSGEQFVSPVIISALAMSAYMQMFSAAMGRFAKELVLPYIYMIPESPFKKLLNCLKDSFWSLLTEGILLWIPLMIISKCDFITILFCIAARISFGYLYISANIILERFMSGLPKIVSTFLYFLISVFMTIPGIIVGIISAITLSEAFSLAVIPSALTVIILINTVITALAVFLSRNMLVYAELNNA